MGIITRSLKGVGIGWPNVGWQPPPGYTGNSITSIPVNHDTAMGVGAFHAGVRLIAEDIASLPFNVLVHLSGGGSQKAFAHPSYAMLHDAPNPDMTAMVWRETSVGHYLTWGNCYSEKEFDGQGNTVRLWPLRPDRMTVQRNAAGERVYDCRLPTGETVRLPARNVLHVPGFGFDGLIGYSRVTMWRRAIENAIAIEEYGLDTFANGASPGVILKHPAQLSKDAKKNIVASWEENHAGLSNAQRTGILDEGMTLEQIGFAPEDAQFLDGKRHSVEDMARALRLAPHKLSDMSRATFSNIEESNIDHVIGTLMPVMVRFEQQVDKDILGAGAFYAKHNAAALMRGNAKDRAEFYVQMRNIGVLTAADIRAFEDLNPLAPSDLADILWPLNSVPASSYDASGMTSSQRMNAAALLVGKGFEPDATLAALNLPSIAHTGLVPTSITLPDTGALP